MLTALDVLSAINKANEEQHPRHAGIVDETHYGSIKSTLLDGHFNLERIADLLNEKAEGAGQSS